MQLNDKPRLERVPLAFDPKDKGIFRKSDIVQDDKGHVRKYEIKNMSLTIVKTYICELCSCIIDTNSLRTDCGHYFCSPCLSTHCKQLKRNEVECSVCRKLVHFNNVHKVDDRFKTQILALSVECPRCEVLTLVCAYDHACNQSDIKPA